MIGGIRRVLDMIRFSHTLFAMPFAGLAAVMAWVAPTPDGIDRGIRVRDLAGVLVCMVAARSAAMAFNRIVDRRFDAANPRTAGRHLPAGLVSARSAAAFTIGSASLFVASTLVFLPNVLPIVLAAPVLAVLFVYSYTKRFTSLSHFWLGFSLMLAPVAVWIAVRGRAVSADPFDLAIPLLLGLGVLFWVAGFDVVYACQDADFDRRSKLHSLPARLGVPAALRLSAACHLATVGLFASLPWLFPALGLGALYHAAMVGLAGLLAYEHWIVRPDDLTRVNLAFFHVNVAVSCGMLAVGSADLLWI
ncbi:MAG: 4-hydroxybenzoate octaprenyltransferase [Planctomycetes bacterium]|nr:4-hydroxybenzoate octaprenyltransferase [Planctomycetota bacterium]